MRSHLHLGRLFGVPVGVNIWVFVVAGVLAFSLSQITLPSFAPDHPGSAYWFGAALGVLGFLGSLVSHEMGHSYVALRNGVHVREVTLWLFGGVAKLDGDADDPGAEFRIAAAGPMMSGVTAAVAAGLAWLAWRLDGSEVLVAVLGWLAAINVVLAVSNLLPAFPLDGGRILRAVMWRRMGRKITATHRAALWGQVLAVGLVILCAWAVLAHWGQTQWMYSGLWTAALALFLFVAARAEWVNSAPYPEALQVAVSDLSRPLPAAMVSTTSVAEVDAVLTANPRAPLVPITDARGEVTSMVTRSGVERIPPAHRRLVPATSVAEPLLSLPRVRSTETVDTVLGRLGRGAPWWALVVDDHGATGALVSGDVDDVVAVAQG